MGAGTLTACVIVDGRAAADKARHPAAHAFAAAHRDIMRRIADRNDDLIRQGKQVDESLQRVHGFVDGRNADLYRLDRAVHNELPQLQEHLDDVSAKVRMIFHKVQFLETKLT